MTAIYDRYRYDKEKRAALEKWAEVLSGIVDVKPAPTIAPAGCWPLAPPLLNSSALAKQMRRSPIPNAVAGTTGDCETLVPDRSWFDR